MSNMKENGFWIGSGVAAGVAVIVFAVLIMPMWTSSAGKKKTITTTASALRTGLGAMPGKQNIETWTSHRDGLKTKYKNIVDSLGKRDSALEQWFPGVNAQTSFDQFMTAYLQNTQELESQVKDPARGNVMVGIPRKDGDGKEGDEGEVGFNWITNKSFKGDLEPKEQEEVKANLQKRYWIARYVTNAMLADNDAKPRRLLDLHFLWTAPLKNRQKFVDPYQGAGGMGSDSDHSELTKESVIRDRWRFYHAENSTLPATATNYSSIPFVESSLPGNGEAVNNVEPPLGHTITFGVAVEIDYAAVPKLVRNLMEPRQASDTIDLPLTVIGLNVFVAQQNPLLMEDKKDFTQEKMAEGLEWKKTFEAKTQAVKPAPVRAYITCQVIDFDPASKPSFAK